MAEPSPSCRPGVSCGRGTRVLRGAHAAFFAAALALALGAAATGVAADADPPIAVRITWGGGKAVAWSGRIRLSVVPESAAAPPPLAEGIDWRMLSSDPLATATMHAEGNAIVVHEQHGLDLNGVEVQVPDWQRARLSVELLPTGGRAKPVRLDVAVADLVVTPLQQPLDTDGNRLVIRRSPGDELRVAFEGSAPICKPGETVRLTVHPLLPRGATSVEPELRLRLKRAAGGGDLHAQTAVLEPVAGQQDRAGVTSPQPYAAVPLAVPLPQQEGGYDIELEVVERGGLRWSRSLATRIVQVVAVADARAEAPAGGDWQVVYELDPGSPKLLERLRRLPGVALPSMAVPGVSLPKMPMPSFTMPRMPLPTPTLPGVPLPNVPVPKLPSVNAIVPGLSGLLSVGSSTLDTHPLGPMLKLPPAAAGPAWEGIALAGVEPGSPHLVEIEYPLDQDTLLGVRVLEQPGTAVRATGGSGIEIRRPLVGDGQGRKLGVHRFVFWPHTRTPLVVIANLSPRSTATFGRVRILAGPDRVAAAADPPAQGTSRRVYMHLPTPDFSGFGAAERAGRDAARSVTDWDSFVGGIRRSAEWASAQGAAGAVVGVYADGATIWPSALSHGAPRWDTAGAFDSASDPVAKDLLALLCRIFGRERLRFVPAIVCNGAVPALESLAARAGETPGIHCIGRDGRPLPAADGSGTARYNILDPRVQGFVVRLVTELAERIGPSPAVDGIAIELTHDGWLHPPGIAWGIDDTTFARFIAAAGPEAEPLARPVLSGGDPDGRRFAGRAALVEGPLRERWLAWREAEVAAFYARLADIVAARGGSSSLYVVPTTLFVEGELAGRFRPTLSADPPDADVMRAIALAPALITAHERVVYVSPHVHAATDDAVERGLVHQANHSLPIMLAAAQAVRRGAVLVERPATFDVKPVLPHGPFMATTAATVAVPAVAAGSAANRPLAAALMASDVEVVFDMGLLHRQVDADDRRRQRSLEVLPADPLDLVEQAAAPLVVRTKVGESGTWVSVVNASGVACRASLLSESPPAAAVDAATREALPVGPAGEVGVDLGPWETKTLVLDGEVRVVAARAAFPPDVQAEVTRLLADLQRRRTALESAVPMAVLDNPGFELPDLGGLVPGWEVLEPKRGALALVAGAPTDGDRGARFASSGGLATLRSNPFTPPATGRISVALWARVAAGAPQPPLRIAIEGIADDREFYRFAPVGRGDGARPLSAEWSQFVLQIDDLPTRGIESLRVRLDLLGPGSVELDDVRVFDLAFDESQRVQLTKLLTMAEARLADGDLGGCLVHLDGYWPAFLDTFVADTPAAAAHNAPERTSGPAEAIRTTPSGRTGVIDRMRRWWQ